MLLAGTEYISKLSFSVKYSLALSCETTGKVCIYIILLNIKREFMLFLNLFKPKNKLSFSYITYDFPFKTFENNNTFTSL